MQPNQLRAITGRGNVATPDLQRAAAAFAAKGLPEAWERGTAVAQQILKGEDVALGTFREEFIEGYLNKWKSRLTTGVAPGLLSAMQRCRRHLNRLPFHLVELADDHLDALVAPFEEIDAVTGVGSTTTSKTLSALRPSFFVMWDMAIAGYYGCSLNAVGYAKFLWLMADFCRAICDASGNPATLDGVHALERRLAISERSGPIPLAKLVDEWNWLTITSRYR